jgi:hypothetical protein
MASRALGTIPSLMILVTAVMAESMEVKAAEAVLMQRGMGRILSQACVTMPSVPSEPTMRLIRSGPWSR